ncbi:MAG: DNA repair protein [Ruminococcaceae bacterium]|nr:DNA repair protein [Oscillospiraceae bacterium]
MDEERKVKLEELKEASPLDSVKILQELELYDAKSSQEIIDEVYEQFASGENMEDEILKPVFLSVVDGILEGTALGRSARKKGLTASRFIQECESFSYDEGVVFNSVDTYAAYKNARENDNVNSNMTQNPTSKERRKLYEDKQRMDGYKDRKTIGHSRVEDEYTENPNLYDSKKNRPANATDEKFGNLAETDHIVTLKNLHNTLKSNYALDDNDIKNIANGDYNFAMTAAEINDGRGKGGMSNAEYIKSQEKKGTPLDEKTKQNMLRLHKEAEKGIEKQVNKTVLHNFLGDVDKKSINEKYDTLQESKIRAYEKKHGVTPDENKLASINEIVDKKRNEELTQAKENQKDKGKEIRTTASKEALSQAGDYAVGNLILFIVKPLYYEFSDIFKNGLQEGVHAESGVEAIKIRFGRIKNHVLTHSKDFLGNNAWEFVKGFVSSLVEGIISLFVGIFKQILKIVKEGIKIFVQSARILFGKDSKDMSPAEKGDAIIKLIGGSVISIAGIGVEALINKIGIGEPWSVVLATMLSGIASALFMYVLDKADIFSVKAEKRRDRIIEIFDERIKDINEASEQLDFYTIEVLKNQRTEFENIKDFIDDGFKFDNIEVINAGLYNMAKFMGVNIEYSNTEEFCNYMDNAVLEL